MKKFFLAAGLAALLILGFCAFSPANAEWDAFPTSSAEVSTQMPDAPVAEKVAEFNPYLVSFKVCTTLSCSTGHGSGTYIGDDYFLTAGHVGEMSKKFVLKRQDGRVINTNLVWISTTSDWALLKADKEVKDITPAKIYCAVPKVDDPVYTVGNPADLVFVKTKGYVASIQKEIKELDLKDVLVSDMTVFGGNSGGPVFNEQNLLVGNVVAMLASTSFSILETTSKICDVLPRTIPLLEEEHG